MDVNLKKLFSYFKFYFLAILILAVICAGIYFARGKRTTVERTNQECTTTERVFDYGEVLSETEEADLRALIAEKEKLTGCDIVLVTLNESLEEYAKAYEDSQGYLEPYQYVMVYADNFYDEHYFGFDKPHGDGVLFLDNWYREADGKIHSWMNTCGKAEDRFTTGEIENLLDAALANVDNDPYGAYVKYVNLFADKMVGKRNIPFYFPLLGAVIATAIFVAVNLNLNKGRKTVNLNTYVEGGRPEIRRREDIFLRKTVTKRKIETSSGSGGGGSHTSSGGVSHGGGGHSR